MICDTGAKYSVKQNRFQNRPLRGHETVQSMVQKTPLIY